MERKWIAAALLAIVLFAGLCVPAEAKNRVDIRVITILASQDSNFIDPSLSSTVRELRAVFRYSSYRLISRNRLRLNLKETGTISLPGGRLLRITPSNIRGNRVELRLGIFKSRQQIFRTTVQLRNRGSMTVGGPKHKGGYLLLNISSSF